MASVSGPVMPRHASTRFAPHARPKSRAPSTEHSSSSGRSDPFYGHYDTATLCARYVTHLFRCPAMPPTSTSPQAQLPYFIAYALHRTKLHSSVTFSALVLLSRLKARFPAARGSSGHRLFISAFMIASKVMCDDTYSNKSWSIVAQNLFTLREINQMEHEMVNYLDWELTVDPSTLTTFETAVKRDFCAHSAEPYPKYPLEMISKRAREATLSPPIESKSSLRVNVNIDPVTSTRSPLSANSQDSVPMTPPGSSYSTSTTPLSTPSPETPIGDDNMEVVIEAEGYDLCLRTKPLHLSSSQQTVLKQQFAQAVPVTW